MNIERDLHMAKGEGETSYVNNSRLQQKALLETEAVLEKAVREVCMDLLQPTMTVVDLGCSSGQNTLFFVSKVIKVVGRDSDEKSRCNPVELQFFLNDLPGNDLPGIHCYHLSISLGYQAPTTLGFSLARVVTSFTHHTASIGALGFLLGLEGGREYLNEGNICVDKTTPVGVAELYRLQFEKDMLLFLKLRYEELVLGGQMVLTFLGRKYEDYITTDIQTILGAYLRDLCDLLLKKCGLVEKEKLDAFNLPIYAPSVNEVKAVVAQNGLFNVSLIKLFESNRDPHDDSEGGEVQNSIKSGINIAKSLRAVFGPLLASHFGELLNKLFKKCANYAVQHLERGEESTFSSACH